MKRKLLPVVLMFTTIACKHEQIIPAEKGIVERQENAAPKSEKQYELKTLSVSTSGVATAANTNFANSNCDASVTFSWLPGVNEVVIVFTDEQDVPFNPNTNEVIYRVDRPNFLNTEPACYEQRNDTSLIYKFNGTPFPAKKTVLGTYNMYYRIPDYVNSLHKNINPVLGFQLFAAGSWTVKVKLLGIKKIN